MITDDLDLIATSQKLADCLSNASPFHFVAIPAYPQPQ